MPVLKPGFKRAAEPTSPRSGTTGCSSAEGQSGGPAIQPERRLPTSLSQRAAWAVCTLGAGGEPASRNRIIARWPHHNPPDGIATPKFPPAVGSWGRGEPVIGGSTVSTALSFFFSVVAVGKHQGQQDHLFLFFYYYILFALGAVLPHAIRRPPPPPRPAIMSANSTRPWSAPGHGPRDPRWRGRAAHTQTDWRLRLSPVTSITFTPPLC